MFNVVSFNVGFVSFNVVLSKVVNHKHFMNYILVTYVFIVSSKIFEYDCFVCFRACKFIMSNKINESCLEDLVKTFQSQVDNSDWLKKNSAYQWEKDNPELAKQYRAAAAKASQCSNEEIKEENSVLKES